MSQLFFSSGSDEFDFSTLNKLVTLIQDALRYKTKESSREDTDEIRGVRQQKIRIINGESETVEEESSLI